MTPSAFILRLSIIAIVLLVVDLYAYSGIKSLTPLGDQYSRWVGYMYWGISLLWFASLVYMLSTFEPVRTSKTLVYRLGAGSMVLIWLPKIVFCLFLLSDDVVRLAQGLYAWAAMWGSSGTQTDYLPSRRAWVAQVGAAVAALPFLGVLHGITLGKYSYTIHRKELYFKDLPPGFDGFTLVQLSDIHSGSLDDPHEVARGVDLVNSLGADLLVFTGDLVNNVASEFESWVPVFSKLKAPMGKYSITGNHDYGEYIHWPSQEAKKANFERLKQLHAETGFRLMLNEHTLLHKGQESIALIGIENWGLPPFPQYGDLTKATSQLAHHAFSILLSHDPSHWDAEVRTFHHPIHLTLSGHTHGMQFGIEIPGLIKWSPVKWKYPRWAGLYQEGEQALYVNRGFGFIGFPGRVGIWPEITHITLRKA